ncbi:MAG: hypothetical protein ACFFCQ_18110, partial [Promethearchaeota archaeon]
KIPFSNQTITKYANLSFHFLLLNQVGLDSNGTTSQITLSFTFDTASVTFFLWRKSSSIIGTPTDREDIRVDSNYPYYFINSTWDGIWHELSVVNLVDLVETYCNSSVNKLYQIEIACGSFPSSFSSVFFIDKLECYASIQPESIGLGLYLENESITFFSSETIPVTIDFNVINWGPTVLKVFNNHGSNSVQGIINLDFTILIPLFFESNFSVFDLENLEVFILFSTLENSASVKKLILSVPNDWKQLSLYSNHTIPLENITESYYKAEITNEDILSYILTAFSPNYIEEIQYQANSLQQGGFINITVKMKSPVEGLIQLSIIGSQNEIIFQTETSCFVSGIVLFSNLMIPFEAPKGNISIEVYWSSKSEAGIGSLKIFIPTSVAKISSIDSIEVNRFEKIHLNGTVLDLETNISVEHGNITVLFEEWSQSFQFHNVFDIIIGPIISNPGNKSLIIFCQADGYVIRRKEILIIINHSEISVKQDIKPIEERLYELHLNVTNSRNTPIAGLSAKISYNGTLLNSGFTDKFGQSVIHIPIPQVLTLDVFDFTIQIVWGIQILWENISQIQLPEVIQYKEAILSEIVETQNVLCNETVIIHAKVNYPSEGRLWYIISPYSSSEIKSVQLLHESEVINVRLEQGKLFWGLINDSRTGIDEIIFQVSGPSVSVKRGVYNDTNWPKIDLNVTSKSKFDSVVIEIPLTVLEKTVTNWHAFDLLGRNITRDIEIIKKEISLLRIRIGTINANRTRFLTITGVPTPLKVEPAPLPETINCNESLTVQINVTSLIGIPFGTVEINIIGQSLENISLSTTNLTNHKYLLKANFGPFSYNTTIKYRILVWDMSGSVFRSPYAFFYIADLINPKAVLNIKTTKNNVFTFSVTCWEEYPYESGIEQVLLLIFSNGKNLTKTLISLNNSSHQWIAEVALYEESRIKIMVRDKAGNNLYLPQDQEYLILKPQRNIDMNFQDVVFLSALVAIGIKGFFWGLSALKKTETIRLD